MKWRTYLIFKTILKTFVFKHNWLSPKSFNDQLIKFEAKNQGYDFKTKGLRITDLSFYLE